MGGFPTLGLLVFICKDKGFPVPDWWKMVLKNTCPDEIIRRNNDMRKLIHLQLMALFFFIAFYGIYAFASTETGTAQSGGEGISTISGWTVSNVQYQPGADPSRIAAVEFDLDGAATVVQVSLNSANPTFFVCENVTGTHWLCNTHSQVSIAAADELRVIATGN